VAKALVLQPSVPLCGDDRNSVKNISIFLGGDLELTRTHRGEEPHMHSTALQHLLSAVGKYSEEARDYDFVEHRHNLCQCLQDALMC
jgi:hypothetical protein